MKYLKTLGLAAITAAALTALMGVGSASAVTLCENNQAAGCTAHVNSGATIDLSAEDSIKLTGPFGIVIHTCTGGTIKAVTSNTGSEDTTTAVAAAVTEWTYSGCSRPTTVVSGGTLSIETSGNEGNATLKSNGTTVTIHEIPAPFPSTCAYTTENTDIGKLTHNATAATFDIEATITSETEGCPNGTWSGHYVSTGTTVRAVGGKKPDLTLCEENVVSGCKSHVNSGKEIDFSAEDSIKLAGPFGIVIDTCTESTIEAVTSTTGTATAVTGTGAEISFGKCNRVITVGGGGDWSIEASGAGGNGTVTSSEATVTVHGVPAPYPSTCAYITTNTDLGTLTASGTAATIDLAATINAETLSCPSGTLSGHYVSTGTVIKAVAH